MLNAEFSPSISKMWKRRKGHYAYQAGSLFHFPAPSHPLPKFSVRNKLHQYFLKKVILLIYVWLTTKIALLTSIWCMSSGLVLSTFALISPLLRLVQQLRWQAALKRAGRVHENNKDISCACMQEGQSLLCSPKPPIYSTTVPSSFRFPNVFLIDDPPRIGLPQS